MFALWFSATLNPPTCFRREGLDRLARQAFSQRCSTVDSVLRRSAASGFTLVEAVIGVAIVTFGSISILSLLMFTRLHNAEEQERARAHQIVSQEIEDLITNPSDAASSSWSQVVWDNGTPDEPADDTVGTVVVSLRYADGTPIPEPHPSLDGAGVLAEVTLAWRPRGGRTGVMLRESAMTFMAPKGA